MMANLGRAALVSSLIDRLVPVIVRVALGVLAVMILWRVLL